MPAALLAEVTDELAHGLPAAPTAPVQRCRVVVVQRQDVHGHRAPQQPPELGEVGYFLYAGRVAVNPLGRPRALQEGGSAG